MMKEIYFTDNGIKWIITEESNPETVRVFKSLLKMIGGKDDD